MQSIIDNIKNIRIRDFFYDLPDEKIAKHPLAQRDACRLIFSSPDHRISHHIFSDLPELLNEFAPKALIIANETKVINARMEFFKSTGSRIEIFLLEPSAPSDYELAFAAKSECVWTCMVGNRKKWKSGPLFKELDIAGHGKVTLEANLLPLESDGQRTSYQIRFSWPEEANVTFADIVEAAGYIPIPPYLNRDSEESDKDDYQTIYSRVKGSVAAPTAGLHFTPEVFLKLRDLGFQSDKVTLHVGAGTFQPVKSENIGDHPMHTEQIVVERKVIEDIVATLRDGRKVIAVGTTSVRTIESLPYLAEIILQHGYDEENIPHLSQWDAYQEKYVDMDVVETLAQLVEYMQERDLTSLRAATQIMIAPGYKWRIVGGMVTNFHQPESTLLLLVSSFLGGEWRQIYDEALSHGYRFLSYGDACLFLE